LRIRTAEEFFGSFCSFFCAAKNSSSVVAGLRRTDLSSARLAANLAARAMRFLLRSMAEVFGMDGWKLELRRPWARILGASEWHAKQAEEVATFIIGLGGRYDGHIDTNVLLDVLDRDLRKDRVVGNPEVVIALAVELRRHTAKVADRRQRHRDQR
jgi:hypothetical protein